jgi:hypothetical protein
VRTDRSADDGTGASPAADDEQVDEAERESFPASDPPSTWAGPDDVTPERTGDAD